MAFLVSVNIGQPRTDRLRSPGATAIDKRPVTGPVAVARVGPKGTGAVGLAGDAVTSHQHHGGTHQALYAYAREDLTDGPPSWAATCRTDPSATTSPPPPST